MKEIFGIGRNRDRKGAVCGLHLNDYTMCIHTLVGGLENDGGFSSGGV